MVDAAEIGEEKKGRAVFGHDVIHFTAALVGIDSGSFDPCGDRFRRFLLKKTFLLNSVRISPHHQGAILEEGKNMVGDAIVIGEQVALPDAGLGKINFVQMRQSESPAINLEAQALRCAASQFLKTGVPRGAFGSRNLGLDSWRILDVRGPRGDERAFFRRAIFTNAKKDGCAQMIVFCPVREFDSRNHRGPNPLNVFA